MQKSPKAFRTISEVADWLGTPTHVLRFWESRFIQIKPVKRTGGRRYYRPADMALLGGIRKLLHEDGLTIRSVQKILRENGTKHVADLSPPVNEQTPQNTESARQEPSAPPETSDSKANVPNASDSPLLFEAAEVPEWNNNNTTAATSPVMGLPEPPTPESDQTSSDRIVQKLRAGAIVDERALPPIIEGLKRLRERMEAESAN